MALKKIIKKCSKFLTASFEVLTTQTLWPLGCMLGYAYSAKQNMAGTDASSQEQITLALSLSLLKIKHL